MDTKKLRYFLAVAEEMSFSKAARGLGVSQSVLSRAIKDIEERVESDLFIRGSNVIKLTPAGEAFLPKVEEALRILEEGQIAIREVSAQVESVLDVGYLPPSYESFVGDAISTFCQAFPSTKLIPHPMDAGPMIEGLRSGKLDVSFIGHICPELEKEFDPFKICEVPLRIVVAEHHPLAELSRAKLTDLSECPLISLTSDDFPGRHELIMKVCRDSGLRPHSVRRVENLLSVLANISSSNSFSIMPEEVKNIATKHVRFLEIEGSDERVHVHALVRQGENRKSVLTLLQECRRIALA